MAQPRGVALPFITVDDDGRFEVHEEAANVLRSVTTNISVVAVAGLYRTGKSFLLNTLVEAQDEGFAIGSTVNACTKGIWIWSIPIMDEDKGVSVVYMDTEGLGSTDRSTTHDSRIFAIALLLSSFFVYNSRGVIDAKAIEDLSLVANLSQMIQLRSNTTLTDAADLHEVFPNFLWVVRDFTLSLEDDAGRRITPRQYLEQCLSPQPETSEAAAVANQIRHIIAQCFASRDCVTMVRPADTEEKLRSLGRVPLEQLRPEFQKQLATLRKKVANGLQAKQVLGRHVNGDMFVELAQSYVTALNEGGVPVVSTALERAVASQCREAMRRSLEAYDAAMSPLLSALPAAPSALSAAHAAAAADAKGSYWRAAGPDGRNDGPVGAVGAELRAALRARGASAERDNAEASARSCRAVVERALGRLGEEVRGRAAAEGADTTDMSDAECDELRRNVEKLRDTLTAMVAEVKAVPGPGGPTVLLQALAGQVLDDITDWGGGVSDAFAREERRIEDALSALQRERSEVKSRIDAKRAMMQQEAATHERSLEELQERVTAERAKLEAEKARRQQEIQRHDGMLADMETLHGEAMEQLRKQNADLETKRADLEGRVVDERARHETSQEAVAKEMDSRRESAEGQMSGLAQSLNEARERLAQLQEQRAKLVEEQTAEKAAKQTQYNGELQTMRSQLAAELAQYDAETEAAIKAGREAKTSELETLRASVAEKKTQLGEGGGGGGGGGAAGAGEAKKARRIPSFLSRRPSTATGK